MQEKMIETAKPAGSREIGQMQRGGWVTASVAVAGLGFGRGYFGDGDAPLLRVC